MQYFEIMFLRVYYLWPTVWHFRCDVGVCLFLYERVLFIQLFYLRLLDLVLLLFF